MQSQDPPQKSKMEFEICMIWCHLLNLQNVKTAMEKCYFQ